MTGEEKDAASGELSVGEAFGYAPGEYPPAGAASAGAAVLALVGVLVWLFMM